MKSFTKVLMSIMVLGVIAAFDACVPNYRNVDTPLPHLATMAATSITTTSAISGGEVKSEGSSSVSQRGICWSTHSKPTLDDFNESSGSGPGYYYIQMDNLNKGAKYYVRAYAINDMGVGYGPEVSFKTLGEVNQYFYYGASDSHQNCWGLTNGGDDEWAVRFPESYFTEYDGASITKVRAYLGMTGYYDVKIYKGGTDSPTTLLTQQSVYISPTGWKVINLDEPLTLDGSQSLWVAMTCSYSSGSYPKGACEGVGNPDARWQNSNGNGWYDVYNYNQNTDICWEIQVFITSNVGSKDGLEIMLSPNPGKPEPSESLQNSPMPR